MIKNTLILLIMRYLSLTLVLIGMLHTTPSHAMIRITNLSDAPQRFLVINSGDQQVITIEPKKTWYNNAVNLVVQHVSQGKRSRTVHARQNDHYAYWPNGTFAIQKKRNVSNRGN